MKFDEYLHILHKYREKRAKEVEELSPGEQIKAINQRGMQIAKRLGLKFAKIGKSHLAE